MPKVKVLFCILYLAHGGTEKQLIALINGLDRNFFEPHLCCINESNIEPCFKKDADFLFDQVNCGKIRFDFQSFRSLRTITQIVHLASYIRRHEIDIIVSYFIDPPIFSYLAGRLSFCNPRFVVAFRDLGLLRSSHNILLRYVFSKSDAFLVNSLAVMDNYVKYDDLPIEKFTVIANGLDLERFVRIRSVTTKPKVIGIVANLNRRVKRVDIFIRAAAIIAEKNKDVLFKIIGEGELRPELESLAAKLGVHTRIKFAGRSYDVAQSLHEIDIGVNTSETEGFSNGVLEYLAAGIPAVVTETGGNKEIVVEGKNGFFFPVNDYKALAERLLMIIEEQDLYEKLCSNAIPSVKNNFGMDLMVQKHQIFFLNLLKNKKS